jgi:poly-beta-hydroxyalkanoate depolymerase
MTCVVLNFNMTEHKRLWLKLCRKDDRRISSHRRAETCSYSFLTCVMDLVQEYISETVTLDKNHYFSLEKNQVLGTDKPVNIW